MRHKLRPYLRPGAGIRKKPAFERLRFPLPKPPGTPSLPPAIFFDVDLRFTEPQIVRIISLINGVLTNWQFHYVQKSTSGTSQFAMCSQKYAKRGLNPVWSHRRVINGLEAANQAMDILTRRFIENGTRKVPVAKINYYIPRPGGRIGARTTTATRKCNVPLTFALPPATLNDQGIGNTTLTGSVLHAFLHRCGYIHPKNVYTTWFSGESAMCVARSYQNKIPGVPDTNITQFFD